MPLSIYQQTKRHISLVVTKALGLTSRESKFSQDLTTFVLLVVGEVPVDSEMSVLTSSISKGSVCTHVSIGTSVRVL
jgi:hypothetical protein